MLGLLLGGLLVVLMFGVPIGIALSLTALSVGILDPVIPINSTFVFRNLITALDSNVLIAIPLFVLSGNIMAKGGISEKIFNFFAYFLGNKTGGLPAAVVVTCLFYGAITGSAPATVAAVGAMAIPLLVSLGYDLKFVASMLAVAGGLGVIIPPSIPFIVYGLSTATSVGDLFLAGVLPGLLIALSLILYIVFYFKIKGGEDKEKLQKNYEELRSKNFFHVLGSSIFALLTPVIILGGIYSGIVTPTEAANISVFYALIVSLFIYRSLKFKDLIGIMKDSVGMVAPILLIVAAATALSRGLTMMQVPQQISMFIADTFTSRIALLLAINGFLLLVGMLLEPLSAIMILSPIFMPVLQQYGIDPIHFGMIMTVNLAIGFVTPPVGMNLYVASSMTKVSVLEIAKNALPFAIMMLVALMMITFIPQISLFLVGL